MAFLLSNFLRNYTSTAKVLEIQDQNGLKVYTFSVCNYQKSSVSGANLLVYLEDNYENKQYVLGFPNESQALQAQIQFKNAINTLIVNCAAQALTPPAPSQTPIQITYVQYKTLQQGGNLIMLQWYDVTDTTNLLGFGGVTFRILAKTVNDNEPAGVNISSQELVIISTLDDTIQKLELASQRILALNNSKVAYDSFSSKLTVSTNSILNSTSSSNIEVSNGSTVTTNNCMFLNVSNNSNIIIGNATKIVINNIQQDLSTIGFNLSNVIIDQSNTEGKLGKTLINNPVDKTFVSYNDTTDEELRFSTSNNTITITLDNKITQANGVFKFLYSGAGLDNVINVVDKNSAALYTINDTVKDIWIVFQFNKNTGLFEFFNLDFTSNNTHSIYVVTVGTNGQTVITLPNPATDASRLQMCVNGQDQLFGPDFTYSNPGTITYQNRHYTLQIGDELKFWIY